MMPSVDMSPSRNFMEKLKEVGKKKKKGLFAKKSDKKSSKMKVFGKKANDNDEDDM